MNKFYITTTLPYVNAKPHIGFALEIIQADVLARYNKSLKKEVFFNTGVDEHGLKIFRKAKEENLSPQEYCNIYAKNFDDLKNALSLSYNNFVRTTDISHKESAQEFWIRCFENGDIYKKNYKIKYCVGCELEKTESELVNEKCPIHPNLEVETIEEENYFFRYSNYQKKLLDFYEKNPKFVVPESKYNEIKEFTKRGLEDFSISRLKEKMPWGVEVPNDKDHIMYVWFDALVNYISVLDWHKDSKNFKSFWPGIQVAGKDNLRQQASMWQAMLMSANLPNSKQIFIHGFITSNGQKMSKSLGNVVDPIELASKYGVDAVRYYLLREIPSTEDGDFSVEKFENRYNSDLASGIGNLLSRVRTMAEKNGFRESSYLKIVDEKRELQKKAIENFRFDIALKEIWEVIRFCDKYIEEKRPWENKEEDKIILGELLLTLDEISIILEPFLPETAEKIKKQLERKERFINKKESSLFPRI